ncbi:MAG: chromosomal replication initiator protein DnaA [Proteobacteria bacterium]|nr:chromosomal replication initiator protein DnaA [Pseudomonadota bacterium]
MALSGFWKSCLCRFEQELSPQQFNTWIRPLGLEGEETPEKGLRLVAPNSFVQKWVRDRYLQQIIEYGSEFFSLPVKIDLVINSKGNGTRHLLDAKVTNTGASDSSKVSAPALAEPRVGENRNSGKPKNAAYDKSRLIPDFSFHNLVVGKANNLARAAAQQVSQNPGGAYNPLFIYGGTGLGKTHLIHAIGNEILTERPDCVVRYVHAEDYYSDVVRAYQQKSFDTFKRYYRSLDVLLIDDVQFFNGKNRTQEEFFFVFNALIESKKQIIITSDTYPKDINGLDDRLVTRFDWGLTVQIEPPELEMRVAILKNKAAAQGIHLDDESSFFIAKHLRSNVRELEGSLNKVLAFSMFHKAPISLDLVKESLKDIVGSVRNVSLDSIQKTVADYYKMKVSEFFSKKRTRAIARPRQVAMWLCREITSHSYPEIGDAFGGRDHTTVIHAVKTIDAARLRENELNHDLHVLLQVLKG